MKRFSLLAIGIAPLSLLAQYNPGPRITALGETGVVVQDVWSLQSNQAGLASLQELTASISFHRKFSNPDLDTKSAVIACPYKHNVFGLSFHRYGFSAYDEQKIGFAYARSFGPSINTALNFNYHQLKIPQYGSARTYSVEAGIQYRATKELLIGAHISNPGRSEYDNDLNASIPVKAEFGVAYRFSDRIQLNTAVVEILNSAADIHFGLEYNANKWFFIRCGFSSNPVMEFGGFGVNYKDICFSVASSYHPTLGFSPQVALGYAF